MDIKAGSEAPGQPHSLMEDINSYFNWEAFPLLADTLGDDDATLNPGATGGGDAAAATPALPPAPINQASNPPAANALLPPAPPLNEAPVLLAAANPLGVGSVAPPMDWPTSDTLSAPASGSQAGITTVHQLGGAPMQGRAAAHGGTISTHRRSTHMARRLQSTPGHLDAMPHRHTRRPDITTLRRTPLLPRRDQSRTPFTAKLAGRGLLQ